MASVETIPCNPPQIGEVYIVYPVSNNTREATMIGALITALLLTICGCNKEATTDEKHATSEGDSSTPESAPDVLDSNEYSSIDNRTDDGLESLQDTIIGELTGEFDDICNLASPYWDCRINADPEGVFVDHSWVPVGKEIVFEKWPYTKQERKNMSVRSLGPTGRLILKITDKRYKADNLVKRLPALPMSIVNEVELQLFETKDFFAWVEYECNFHTGHPACIPIRDESKELIEELTKYFENYDE